MKSAVQRLLACVMLGLSGAVISAPPTEAELPVELRDWRAWVLHGEEYRACPAGYNTDFVDSSAFVCAWPGELTLEVGADGATFTQSYEVFAKTLVPLPGDESLQPIEVTVSGSSVPVMLADGSPVVMLDAGRHSIAGRLRFDERPESIRVPAEVARVQLSVDGKSIFPLSRSGDELWLGRAESATVEADSLSIQVFRLLTDGIPANLETRLVFEVSGKGREEVLPAPLPAGFEATSLGGDLPSRLESDGRMHVQVRPGTFTVRLSARALAPLTAVSQIERDTPWPPQEIWSYQPNGGLRVTEASGPPQIDPGMAEVPQEWRSFPAFMIEGKAELVVTESSRGMAAGDANRLGLGRQLWLDFDGQGWTLKDQINGSMTKDWRLDVRAPLVLGRATENGEPSLITRSVGNKALGVEVRNRNLNLATTSREESGTRNLPVTGWAHTFDTVTTYLQLPPGYRLWAALGVDSAPESWLDRWDLLDVFFAILTIVLFAVCFGRWAAIVPAIYVALAWHEPDAPRFMFLFALALLAVAKAIDGDGRFGRWMRWIAKAFGVIVVLLAVPFLVTQIRFALYPQLVSAEYGSGYYDRGRTFGTTDNFNAAPEANMVLAEPAQEAYDQVAPAPAAPPAPQYQTNQAQSKLGMAGGSVSLSELRRNPQRKMQRYDSNVVVYQNGYAEPSWSYHGHSLNIQGPVDANQNMRLLISPPWLTMSLRFLLIAALAWSLIALVVRQFKKTAPSRRLGFGVVLLAAGFAANASVPPTPPAEILAELGSRLREAPECAPACARVAESEVAVEGERITIALNVHAAARTAVPLPGNSALLALESLTLDGVAVEHVTQRDDGLPWIVVGRGVHRVQLTARMANTASIDINFPLQPGWIDARATGWELSGISDGQLSTGSLNLTRAVDGASQLEEAGVAQRFAPFVHVTRQLDFDLDWSVYTTVTRLAPDSGAFTIQLPLIAGERVLSADLKAEDGKITLPFADGAYSMEFESRLDAVPTLQLDAPDMIQRAEVWRIGASPTWNVLVGGVPGVHPQDAGELFEFHPLPKERLNLQVTRPEAIPGGTIAFDLVNLQSTFAKRSVNHQLSLQWRATQGGQHGIVLPPDAEVLSVGVNGQILNLRPEKQVLRVPITPGTGNITIQWRHVGEGSGLRMQTPVVDLKAPASNISLGLVLPEDRWTIAASGPALGPAVLYWGELLAMILIAFALSRTGRTTLKLHDWLLLGIGFSTVSWFALVVFAGWLFLVDWRKRLSPEGCYWKFDLLQLFFVGLTVAALIALFVALQTGLVGQPDLHVISRGYGPSDLKWFNDLSDSILPQGSAITLPIWLYRVVMLVWAFWMAWSLVRWSKEALAAFMQGGVWQPVFKPRAAATAAGSAPEAAAPPIPAEVPGGGDTSPEAESSAHPQADLPLEPNEGEPPK